MDFEIIGEIRLAETFARGSAIRELNRLRKFYGLGNWRKRKGCAMVRLSDGTLREAEIHWYEANGICKYTPVSVLSIENTDEVFLVTP